MNQTKEVPRSRPAWTSARRSTFSLSVFSRPPLQLSGVPLSRRPVVAFFPNPSEPIRAYPRLSVVKKAPTQPATPKLPAPAGLPSIAPSGGGSSPVKASQARSRQRSFFQLEGPRLLALFGHRSAIPLDKWCSVSVREPILPNMREDRFHGNKLSDFAAASV